MRSTAAWGLHLRGGGGGLRAGGFSCSAFALKETAFGFRVEGQLCARAQGFAVSRWVC